MVIGVAGIVGEMVWNADSGERDQLEVIAKANSTTIPIQGAVRIALGSIVGKAIVVELEKRGDMECRNPDL